MPVISTNTAANTAVRYLNLNSSEQSDSLSKLASGSRITTASDDAAGLAIATKLSSDVTALEQAATNASHGISILQTADAGASNVSDILERMKTLASQSASGTVTDTERTYIQAEFDELMDEIDDISTSTRYNGQSLLDGTSDFSDDTVETAASVESDISDVQTLTGVSSAITATVNDTLSFDINGTTISLTADTTEITVDDLVSAINAKSEETGVTATNDNGTLTLTGDTPDTNIEITDVSGTGTTLGTADITDLGFSSTGYASVTTSLNSSIYGAATDVMSFDLNDTTISLTVGSDGEITTAEMLTAINAQTTTTGVTASLDSDGNVVLTQDDTTSEIKIDNITLDDDNTGLVSADLSTLGIEDTDADGSVTFAAGSLSLTGTADTLDLQIGETASFDVNGTTVTLGDADSEEAMSYSAQDIADAINDALAEAGDYDVTASVDEETGELVVASRAEGEDTTVTLDNFTGSLDDEDTDFSASDLGMVANADGEVTDTGTTTESETSGASIVVGSDYTDTITLTIASLTTESLSIDDLDVSTQEGAEEALAVIDDAIDIVSQARAEMGAVVSRLEYRSTQLETSIENLEASESAISDVDIASEQARLSAASVKVQAAVAAASQANEMPENLLKLLQ